MHLKIISSTIFLGFTLLMLATNTCLAADTGQRQPTARKQSTRNNNANEFGFFMFTKMAFKKKFTRSGHRTYDPFLLTTVPFFLVTDIVMSPTVTTGVTANFLNNLNKRPAAWNNPNSMIAKVIEIQAGE